MNLARDAVEETADHGAAFSQTGLPASRRDRFVYPTGSSAERGTQMLRRADQLNAVADSPDWTVVRLPS